jgi:hypothetical protein
MLPDSCRIFVGTNTPTIEIRLDAREITDSNHAFPRYAIGVDRLSHPSGNDVSWIDDSPSFTTSKGGMMDEGDELVSICDIGCPDNEGER